MDENTGNNTPNIVGWLLTGAAIGAIATILLHPASRANLTQTALTTSKQIDKRKEQLSDTVSNRADDVQDMIVDKMEDLADFIKDKAKVIKKSR